MAEQKRKLEPSRYSAPLLDPDNCLPQVSEVHTFGKFLSSTEHERTRRAKPAFSAHRRFLDTPGPGSYSISSSFEVKPVRKKAKFMSVRLPAVPTYQEELPANSRGLNIQGLTEESPHKAENPIETRPTPHHSQAVASSLFTSLEKPRMQAVSLNKFPYQKLNRAGKFSASKLKPTSESRHAHERLELGLGELKMVGKPCGHAMRKRIRVLRNHPLKAQSVTRLAASPDERALPKVRGLQLRRRPPKKAPHVVVVPQAWVRE